MIKRKKAVLLFAAAGSVIFAGCSHAAGSSDSRVFTPSMASMMNAMPGMKDMRGMIMTDASCGVLSTSVLDTVFGVIVSSPVASSTRTTTNCTYKVGAPEKTLNMRIEMAIDHHQFSAQRSMIEASGMATKTLKGLGQESFTYISPSTTSPGGHSTTLVVRIDNIELMLTAPTSLGKLPLVAQGILPSL